MGEAWFSPQLFQFLRELEKHNDRNWFEANRHRYEGNVKEPMLRFITHLGKPLHAISPHLTVDPRPVGGSMFRIYRDIRFSKDKSPYKTNIGAHFFHLRAGKDESAPGFYLHLEPGHCLGGGGLWHPTSEALQKVRERIVSQPKEWRAIRGAGIDVQGESLKRVPAGYDVHHPFAEDLKLKDMYVTEHYSERDATRADFLDRFVATCRSTGPLMRFLTQALGLPW